METKIEGLKIPYSVRKSDEASRARIDHKLGDFTVVIPDKQNKDPEKLLLSKKSWVRKKRKEYLRFKRKIPERDLTEGGEISVVGQKLGIRVEKNRSNEVGENIILAKHLVKKTSLKDQLEKTLRKHAREVIEEKVEKYSSEVSEDYGKIYIRNQDTRWGSCSSKGNLNFNWRLILGPENILEYVVVHELVHLEEKKHDEEFWSKVRQIYPEYKRANRWLSEKSSELVFDRSLIETN